MSDLLSVCSSANLVAGGRWADAPSGTVPVGTVHVCAPVPHGTRASIWRFGRTRTGRECSTRPARASHGVPVMPNAATRLDDHEIEPERQVRHRLAARQRTSIEQTVGRRANPRSLAMVNGLFRQAEGSARSPADLDHDERGRRTRVDRHEVELVATDMDVPGQDGPTGFRKARSDERFGGITRLLGRRSRRVAGSLRHRGILPMRAYPWLTPGPSRLASPAVDTDGTKAYISASGIAVINDSGSRRDPSRPGGPR